MRILALKLWQWLWRPEVKAKTFTHINHLEVNGKRVDFSKCMAELPVFTVDDMDKQLTSTLKKIEPFTFIFEWRHGMDFVELEVSSLSDEGLRELRLGVISQSLFDVDTILNMPINTPKLFARWCAAMRSGEVPEARIFINTIETEMRERGMRKPTKIKMPRLKPRKFVYEKNVDSPVYGSSRRVQA